MGRKTVVACDATKCDATVREEAAAEQGWMQLSLWLFGQNARMTSDTLDLCPSHVAELPLGVRPAGA